MLRRTNTSSLSKGHVKGNIPSVNKSLSLKLTSSRQLHVKQTLTIKSNVTKHEHHPKQSPKLPVHYRSFHTTKKSSVKILEILKDDAEDLILSEIQKKQADELGKWVF